MGDQDPSANNNIDIECKIAIIEDEGEGEDHYQYCDRRRIQRVPKLMRIKKHNEDYYTPKMVSFGPYYHGFPGLHMAEEFKHKVLTLFVSSSGKAKKFFYCQIFKVVDRIRNCYVGVLKDSYDDEALAEMMLLDGCFAIYLMEIFLGDRKKYSHFCQHLGMALLSFAFQDMYLIENQIPLWVIMFLTELIYGNKEEGQVLFYNFLSEVAFGVSGLTRIPGEDKMQPLHILDAAHRILVQELDNAAGEELVQKLDNYAGSKNPVSKCLWWPWRKQNPNEFGKFDRQSRSVTDLKAKGIHFKPSSYCLKNIKFKSYTFYGQLQLPVWIFTTHSKQFFIHMIAYEASPESDTDVTMICYVNFLKSLIVKPEDVKELREKKILFSTLDSDEQVMEVIKDIDTRGLDDDSYFYDVKTRIEEHCSNKAKTWIAELIHTYLRSPWTFIALLAATFLLCLTFLQTYYTMNPK